MSHFMCLTDIVKCNLTDILNESDNPDATLREIIVEMQEGLAGAERAVRTAAGNEKRLRDELDEQKKQISIWSDRAREAVKNNNEAAARDALVRKREHDDLVAGLERELQAADATREHLTTTLRALEARLAHARRHQRTMTGAHRNSAVDATATLPCEDSRSAAINDELDALKRELGQA